MVTTGGFFGRLSHTNQNVQKRASELALKKCGSANFVCKIHPCLQACTTWRFYIDPLYFLQLSIWRGTVRNTRSCKELKTDTRCRISQAYSTIEIKCDYYSHRCEPETDFRNVVSELKKDPGVPRLPDLKVRVRNRGKQWAHPVCQPTALPPIRLTILLLR